MLLLKKTFVLFLFCAASFGGSTQAEDGVKEVFRVTVASGEFDRQNSIVRVPFDTETQPPSVVELTSESGLKLVGQVAPTSAIDQAKDSPKKFELQFLLPKLGKGKTVELTATASELDPKSQYKWHDDGSAESELQFQDSPLIKYMYQPLDDSSKSKRDETYKVSHHIYRPDGKALMTKGAGGLFPHHRGIYYGFNRISYAGKQADVWHCKKGESQTHQETYLAFGGSVFGRDVNSIHWRGQDGKPFVTEVRETTTRKIGDGLVVDFHSTLQNLVDSEIAFRGDPQHAGAQFRATQDVPDHTKHLTYYVRPDGVGTPGKFRNWSAKKGESATNLKHINLAWNAVCLALPKNPATAEGKLAESDVDWFTVCYLDSPSNPKPARFSERDYGRFGSYFEYDLEPKQAFSVRYRYCIMPGKLSVKQIEALSRDFVEPVKAELK